MRTLLKRRDFLKTSSALLAGTAIDSSLWASERSKCSSPTAAAMGWGVGVAQYTFRRFSFYEALEMSSKLGIQNIEPAFFLRLDKARPDLKINEDLSREVRRELKQRLGDKGITISGFYSNLNTDAEQAKKIFGFCQEMGIASIVAEPKPEAPRHDREASATNTRSTWQSTTTPRNRTTTYWKPENVLALCKGRSPRVGACCDTGHWVRSGLDPVACLKTMEGRGARLPPEGRCGDGQRQIARCTTRRRRRQLRRRPH